MNRISEKEARLEVAANKLKKGMPRHERRIFVAALVAFRNGLEIECMGKELGPPVTAKIMKQTIAQQLKDWTRAQLEEYVADEAAKAYLRRIAPMALRAKMMGVKNVRDLLDKMIQRAEQFL